MLAAMAGMLGLPAMHPGYTHAAKCNTLRNNILQNYLKPDKYLTVKALGISLTKNIP